MHTTGPTERPAHKHPTCPVGWSTLKTHTHTHTHAASLSLSHYSSSHGGRTMNLHSPRYGQRRRTASRLHNHCTESGLVMWFVTPSAPPLMWLRDGLSGGRPCRVRWWALIGEAELKTRKCFACDLSRRTPRIPDTRTQGHNDDCWRGRCPGVAYVCVCLCVCLIWVGLACSHFSLLRTKAYRE